MIPLKPLTLPPLPYTYNVFEPNISGEAMKIHYEGHHKGYVTTFNTLLEKLDMGAELGRDVSPLDLEFNFLGHLLHSYYWNNITPKKTSPRSTTKMIIKGSYQNLNNFLDTLVTTASNLKGSGWVVVVHKDGHIMIKSIPNHELFQISGQPLLVMDIWEHAYYLDYQNRKRTFFEEFISIINWDTFEKRLLS